MGDNHLTVIPTEPYRRSAPRRYRPMGFARFGIGSLHPNRAWLTPEEPTRVANALGHPLRQILTHRWRARLP